QGPSHFALFVPDGSTYRLHFTDAMDGRIARPEGVVTLATLRDQGRARRERDGWSIALDTTARGKVQVGQVSVLFQFVPAPPLATRPQLPVAIRERPFARTDGTYNACLAGFLFLAFGAVSFVEYGYDPVVEDTLEDAANVVRLVMPPIDEAAPPPVPDTVAQPTDAPATPPERQALNQPRADHPAPANAADPGHAPVRRDPAAAAALAMAAALRAGDAAIHGFQRSMEFNPLVGLRQAEGGVMDRIANGAEMNQTAEDMANAGGVETGDHGIQRTSLTARADIGRRDQLGRGTRIATDGPEINTGTSEQVVLRTPTGRIHVDTPEPPTGPGELPPATVAAVIRHNLGGLQWCYTEGLRNHPSLQGRIEVSFTIGSTGRITGAAGVHGFDEAPEVRQCLGSRFRSMVFPQPEGGAVEFTFPFQFVPGT
ncbi:MAG: AgmX/PglI C-terminal domain-containing protein, partial [Deltaproteobacteria bacterium]